MSCVRGIAVATALLATIASTLSVYPHQLAYFNELAGGPENGHKHLLHSNVDWGQDLLYLRGFLEEHRESLRGVSTSIVMDLFFDPEDIAIKAHRSLPLSDLAVADRGALVIFGATSLAYERSREGRGATSVNSVLGLVEASAPYQLTPSLWMYEVPSRDSGRMTQ